MDKEKLQKVYDSLSECTPPVESFSWGPTYEFALQRRTEALKILEKELHYVQRQEQKSNNKELKSKLGFSRVGRNNI